MSQLIPFQFDLHEVRTLVHDDGSIWWVLTDVCAVLGLVNAPDAASRLESNEYQTIAFSDSLSRNPNLLIVNEPGLYRLIFRSNKEEAKRFQTWVFTEVLPALRKTGGYAFHQTPPPPQLSPKERLVELIECAKIAEAYLAEIGQLNSRDRLMFADSVRTAYARIDQPPTADAQSLPSPEHFDIADRVKHLGYTLTRTQQASLLPLIGKAVAAEYRTRYDKEPESTNRFVDGKVRPVRWYTHAHTEWLDAVVQVTLTQHGVSHE